MNILNLKPIGTWISHTLPAVYDDSLSYYEVLSKVMKNVNDITADLITINENFDNLEEVVDVMDDETKTDLEEIYKRLDLAEADITQAKSDITEAKNEIKTAKDEITILQIDLESLEGRTDTNETDIETLKTRMKLAEADLTSLYDSVEGIEKCLDDMYTDLKALEERMAAAEANITDLQNDMIKAQDDLVSLDIRMSTAEGKIADLQNDMEGALKNINEINEALETYIPQFKGDISTLEDRADNTDSVLMNYNDRLEIVEEDYSGTLKGISELLADMEQMQTTYEKIRNDIYTQLDDIYKRLDKGGL